MIFCCPDQKLNGFFLLIKIFRSKSNAKVVVNNIMVWMATMYNWNLKSLNLADCKNMKTFWLLRSDGGGKLNGSIPAECIQNKGDVYEIEVPYSPNSNGKVNRLNRTLLDIATPMLLDKPEAPRSEVLEGDINTATYIQCRLIAKSSDKSKTLYKILYYHVCQIQEYLEGRPPFMSPTKSDLGSWRQELQKECLLELSRISWFTGKINEDWRVIELWFAGTSIPKIGRRILK